MRSIGALFFGLLVVACTGSGNSGTVTPAPIATVDVPPADSAKPIAVTHDEPERAPVAAAPTDDPSRCRDPRRSAQVPRSRTLVVTEVSQLEKLLDATAPSSPDRPQIMRRIAEGYAEIAAASVRDGSSASIITAARTSEIAAYRQLKTSYPAYPQNDEVSYFLALAEEAEGDLQGARRTYFELVRDSPSSKYIPFTYLAFGEMFFREAQSDASKWELATQGYNEVIKYPPPGNPVWGYAWLQIARIAVEKGDYPRALNAYSKVIDFGAQFSQLLGAPGIAEISRNEIIPAYAKSGDPDKAYNFFARFNGRGSDRTLTMLEALGDYYLAESHFPEATVLYRGLAARDSAHACKWQAYSNYTNAAISSTTRPSDVALRNALAACP